MTRFTLVRTLASGAVISVKMDDPDKMEEVAKRITALMECGNDGKDSPIKIEAARNGRFISISLSSMIEEVFAEVRQILAAFLGEETGTFGA